MGNKTSNYKMLKTMQACTRIVTNYLNSAQSHNIKVYDRTSIHTYFPRISHFSRASILLNFADFEPTVILKSFSNLSNFQHLYSNGQYPPTKKCSVDTP